MVGVSVLLMGALVGAWVWLLADDAGPGTGVEGGAESSIVVRCDGGGARLPRG